MKQKKKLDFSRLFFCSTIILCGSLAKHAHAGFTEVGMQWI
jgi:hypothetical protein